MAKYRKPRRIMRAFKINEISAVDVPAQEGAVALIMKRREGSVDVKIQDRRGVPTSEDLEKNGGGALTTAEDGHAHLIALLGHAGDEMNSGSTTWVDEHTHPWIRTEAGDIIIGMASSEDGTPHNHELGELSKSEPKETTTMADDTKKLDEATQAVEKLEKQLERANLVAALNDADKAHLETLKGDDAEAFLAKSVEDRKAVLDEITKRAKDDDPVVYTTSDGIELRKSHDPAFVAMAKSNDEIRKDNAALRETNENAALEKRAETELEFLPGDLDTRVAMLKAIDGIKDDAKRGAAMNALKAQNEAMSKAFETAGHGASPAPGSPDDELETLAKAYHEKHPDVTYEAAYDKVLKTDRGAELYNKSIN